MKNEQTIKNIKDSILKDVNVNIQHKINRQIYTQWFLWGIVILILLAILGMQIPKMDFESNYVALILGFIGFLATFIVIGNFAQIKEIERKFDSKGNELEQLFNVKVKDTECKISSFFHYQRGLQSEKDKSYSDAFDGFMFAIASWHDSSFIDIKMLNSLLYRISIIITQHSIDSIISHYIAIDGYALDFCLDTLYSKEIVNKDKHKVIFFINELKEKGKEKISYEENIEF